MIKEKVLKLGISGLVLYYLRMYISKAMIGCEYIWDKDGLRFLTERCLWIFVLVSIISLAMWIAIILSIIYMFKKEVSNEKEYKTSSKLQGK